MKEFYTIGEIATDLDVSLDKLRRWEKTFPKLLKPIRRNNWRYYRDEDLSVLRGVKYLLDHGFPVPAVKRINRTRIIILAGRAKFSVGGILTAFQ